MDRDEAREIKLQLADFARDLAERAPGEDTAAAQAVRAPTLALGLAPREGGGYGIAVRYRPGLGRDAARDAPGRARPS